jgi:ankyrin repeat protein
LSGGSALALAAWGGNAPIVQLLLAAGARDDQALGAAVFAGRDDVAETLLARGVSAPAIAEATASAAGDGHVAILRRLLSKLADVPRDGVEALTFAANENQVAAIALLLDAGVPVDAVDAQGDTALLRAARSDCVEAVDLLLSRGASAAARTREGATALHVAIGTAVGDRLLAHGAIIDAKNAAGATALVALVGYLDLSLGEAWLPWLVAKGADVNATDADGASVLFLVAASRGSGPSPDVARTGVAKLLLDHGARVDAATARGATPLLAATASDSPLLVRLLLDRGARVDARDADGVTVWKAAANLPPDQRPAMLAALRHRGSKH